MNYIALWCHEFWHYWYATAILHDTKAYIQYHPLKIAGWCVIYKSDLWVYAIGGLGTAAVFFIFWFFAASFPNRLSLPWDFSLIYVTLSELFYAPIEVLGLYYGHTWLYNYVWVIAITALAIVLKTYWVRIVEYLRGKTLNSNKT
jgi:hypothetical protein